jgi:hypothetical protein
MKVLVESAVYFEHVLLIRCDIQLRSVERSGDVENWMDFFLFAARVCSERLQKVVHSNREKHYII